MVTKPKLRRVKLDRLIVDAENPRTIDQSSAEFAELVRSVKARGVIVPVHVRKHPSKENCWQLLAGERRFVASLNAKLTEIPAIDHGEIADVEAFEITFAENFARKDLTPLEQGRAVVLLLEKYKGDSLAVASKLGKSNRWVLQRQALGTKLTKAWVKAASHDGEWRLYTAAHLQLIAALPKEVQGQLLHNLNGYNDYTVKQLETQIEKWMRQLSKAPWLTDGKLSGKCARCQKRSAAQPGLFDESSDAEEVKKNDRCLDRKCWMKKMASYMRSAFERAKKENPTITPVANDATYGERLEFGVNFNLHGPVPDISSGYGLVITKQGDKNAKPGFVIIGRDEGSIKWFRPVGSNSAGSGRVLSGPTPMAERRLQLASKRGCKLLEKLYEIIATKEVADLLAKEKTSMVMALAIYFGVSQSFHGGWLRGCEDIEELLLKSTATTDIREELWESVCGRFLEGLHYGGPVTQLSPDRLNNAKAVAGLFDIDLAALEGAIAAEIPEPRSWAGLNKDGTPKAKPVKKQKAASQKRKPSSNKKLKSAKKKTKKTTR